MARETIIQKMASHIDDFNWIECHDECPVYDFCDVIQSNPANECSYTCYDVLSKVFNHVNRLARLGNRDWR